MMKMRGIITFIDSSQGAGKLEINMKEAQIDFLAFTGHKDLYGIPGVGGLCCESTAAFAPLIQGGTGIHGENYVNPDVFPEGYEAGTLNMPAIWALKAGIDYIKSHRRVIEEKELALTQYLIDNLAHIDGITLFDKEKERVSTCCFTHSAHSTDKIISLMDKEGMCARGGIHCAILAHESLGTAMTGTVRISLNFMNSFEEIDALINLIRTW